MANGPAVITAAFPKSERGGALGTMGMVVSAGLLSGPALGGLLIGSLGWRSIFWVNLPVGLLGLVLAARFVEQGLSGGSRFRFDWKGAVLQAAILLLFLAAFDPPDVQASRMFPLLTEIRWLTFLAAAGLFILFLRVEARAEAPLFDISLLRIRSFWMSNLASFLTFVSYSTVSVLMPFFLQRVLNLNPQQSGWMMTAIPLTIFVVAPLSGRLSDRFGTSGLSSLGAAVGGMTLLVFSGVFGGGVHPGMDLLPLAAGLAAVGLATGLFQSPNNSAIMSAVPLESLGVASALLATIRNLGMVVGTGLSTALFGWRLQQHGDFSTALQFTFALAAGVTFVASFVSFLRRN
jgi:MFS family permease